MNQHSSRHLSMGQFGSAGLGGSMTFANAGSVGLGGPTGSYGAPSSMGAGVTGSATVGMGASGGGMMGA